ncbi:MAG: DUF5999 family protein [Frankia sp.]
MRVINTRPGRPTTSAPGAGTEAGRTCPHDPPCPTAEAVCADAARVVTGHPDQGWSLLCNGVILFDDTGEILPTGRTIEPRRCLPRRAGGRDTCVPSLPRSRTP